MYFRRLRSLCSAFKLGTLPLTRRAYFSVSAEQRAHIENVSIARSQHIVSLHNYTPHRCKKTSSKWDEEDNDDWESLDLTLSRDSKVVKFKASSMRMDLVLKSALSIARNKIEKVFYDSKIRLNGRKVTKKSVQVHVGDEIDIVKGFSLKNPQHILVSRVEILDMAVTKEEGEELGITISVRRFKTLLIDNYDKDPYKQYTAQSD